MADAPHILPNIPKVPGAQRREALPYEPVCAIFRRYLHGQQLKFTPERAMILDAVLRKTGLFQADQLVSDLNRLGHRVSRATAYRTLAHLQDAGILKQVFFDNKQSHYEVIAGRQTYDYLICVATGKVIEFSSDKVRRLRDEICREHGFDPLSHQLHIYGISAEGREQTQQDNDGVPAAGLVDPMTKNGAALTADLPDGSDQTRLRPDPQVAPTSRDAEATALKSVKSARGGGAGRRGRR
jgi:Fur family ferric uptake transcriptional regulator